MAQHRVRYQVPPTSSLPASDLLAGLGARRDEIRGFLRRLPATRSTGVPAALSRTSSRRTTSSTLPIAALAGRPVLPARPVLPGRPSVTSVRSRRTAIAAVLAGAFGLAAAGSATPVTSPSGSAASGSAASGSEAPRSPARAAQTVVQAAPTPVAAVAAAAFSRSRPQATDIAFSPVTFSPVTGADLAAAALTTAGPAPAAALEPATTAPATPTPATPAPGTTAPATAIQQAPSNAVPSKTGADLTATDKTDKNAADKKATDMKATQTTAAAAAGGSSAGVQALVFARAAIGKPYRYGAAGPNAFDCSGLVMSAFKKAGVRLPRTSAAQSRVGTAVRGDQLQPGDLLFFYTPVSHVGIYLGGGKMVHASTSGQPVKISRIGGRPLHNARRI